MPRAFTQSPVKPLQLGQLSTEIRTMDDKTNPPIEPGPEPDTTDAAHRVDEDDTGLDAEDAPAMLDSDSSVIEESPPR